MPRTDRVFRCSADLPHIIERQVFQRTWGRIHRLQVEVDDDRVIVRGRTASYYSKQLALEGVLDVVGTAGTRHVLLDIQVAPAPPVPVVERQPTAHRVAV